MNLAKYFKAIQKTYDNEKVVYLDGPAGTQVPDEVIDAISAYYLNSNSNSHGYFRTTIETDELIHLTRSRMANFLGAEGPHNISFGQNMTTLTYSLARAVGRFLQPGDEVLITQLDHEANRGPWLALEEMGMIVREIKVLPDGTLDYDDMREKINENTRLLAMGWASNLTGTINDVRLARKLTYEAGAWLLLDAVHYAPHFHIDVQNLGCDFLLCSSYKFYGPHIGILYSKTGLLDRLPTDRLRTADQHAPFCIETGTLNHAALAGVNAAIQFIMKIGSGSTERLQLQNAMKKLSHYERGLAESLYAGIEEIPETTIIGPEFKAGQRAPTISFVWKGKSGAEVCKFLAKHHIYAWDGHFYALRASEVLGLLEIGGVTRMGISGYTTPEDISRTISVLKTLV